ncbi:MAG TPA: hypothetical protein VLG37_04740 [Candidatus Saccharimonadales bacterium]|nr:hypothetical protein [Candidatus Saccharimonadales bacterium]
MTAQDKFREIAKQLEPLGVVESKMFGMPTWKLNGKSLGGPWEDDMVFKLGEKDLAEALKLPGAKLFDPMGGRPMKQWVRLGPEHENVWAKFAEAAVQTLLE